MQKKFFVWMQLSFHLNLVPHTMTTNDQPQAIIKKKCTFSISIFQSIAITRLFLVAFVIGPGPDEDHGQHYGSYQHYDDEDDASCHQLQPESFLFSNICYKKKEQYNYYVNYFANCVLTCIQNMPSSLKNNRRPSSPSSWGFSSHLQAVFSSLLKSSDCRYQRCGEEAR